MLNCVALVALAVPAGAFFNEPRIGPVMLAVALAGAIGGFRNIGMVRLEQELEFRRIVALQLGRKLVTVLVTISIAVYAKSYWALVVGLVVSSVTDVVLSYALHPYRPRFAISASRELVGFSKWLLLNNLLLFLSTRGFDFITGSRAGPAAVGTFSVAYELANLPTSELVHPIMRAVFPAYAKLVVRPAEIAHGFRMVFGAIALFALPAGAGIAVLSDAIVQALLGEKWIAAGPLMVALALHGTLRALQANTGPVYVALGQPRIATALTGAYVVTVLPTFAIVLAQHGLFAATCSLVVCYSVGTVVNFSVLVRKIEVTALDLIAALVRPLGATAVMVYVVLLAKAAWQPVSFPWTITALSSLIVVGAGVYALTLLALWALSGRPAGAERTIWAGIQRLATRRSPRAQG